MSMGFDPVLSTVHVVKNELAGEKRQLLMHTIETSRYDGDLPGAE